MLTDEQLDTLRTELEAPAYAEHLAAGDDSGIAALLNARTIPGRRMIPAHDLRDRLMDLGVWYYLRLAQVTPETPPEVRAAVEFVIDAAEPSLRPRNLDGAAAGLLFDVCEQANIISADQRATILALGDTLINRADELGLPAIDHSDVAKARN